MDLLYEHIRQMFLTLTKIIMDISNNKKTIFNFYFFNFKILVAGIGT